MKERRRVARITGTYPLIYMTKGSGRLPVIGSSETVDITPQGVRFPIFHSLSPEDPLYLAIYVEYAGDPVTVIARTRWVSSFEGGYQAQMGVQFMKIAPQERRRLRELQVA